MSKRLLIVGSNSIHVYNFIILVEDFFDEILLLTDRKNQNYNVSSFELDFSLGLGSILTIQKINHIAKEFKPTVIHMHQANSYAFLTLVALRHLNIQKILTAWGSDILINPGKNIFFKKMVQYILNHVDKVTADSNVVLHEANKLILKNLETYNINFGLEVPECNGAKDNMIYTNRLHKKLYNIDKILISFSKFVLKFPDWKLIIAGIGEETDNLKNLSYQLDLDEHIEFIGFVDSKINYEYYCKAKIYVSIPSSDSVSLSLIEAIICGAIPFVSDLAANREIMNEKIGYIVNDEENIDFLKYQEIDNLKFEKERKKIEKLFSKDVNRRKYLSLYEDKKQK